MSEALRTLESITGNVNLNYSIGLRLSAGVSVTAEGLRKTVPAEPISKSAAAPEMMRLAGPAEGKKPPMTCRLFVPTVVSPGGAAWFAVSRREYRAETGQDFAADHFAFRLPDEPSLKPEPSKDVPAALISRAARALNSGADDLAWVAVRLPASLLGPLPLHPADGPRGDGHDVRREWPRLRHWPGVMTRT